MIRNITPADFRFIYGLYMHPKVNPFLLYEQMDKTSFEPIFDDLLAENIIYIYSENEENIGMFKLIRLKHRCSHIAYLGGVAIHPDFAGKGYGKKMLQAIIDFGKELGLLRLELSVASTNQKAIALYENIGFEKEGLLKKYGYLTSKNTFLDEFYMAYLY